jgi:hypothetical protein
VARLQSWLRPIMLRRTKAEVDATAGEHHDTHSPGKTLR